jgi:hypothetical protein
MVANTTPIFPLTPNITVGQTIATANTAKDGTGAVITVHTAGASGSRIEKLRIRSLGTNIATVLRLFINNGLTNATATNNILFEDISLPATTNSENSQLLNQEIGLGISIPAGYKLMCTIGTTVASGYALSVIAGDY